VTVVDDTRERVVNRIAAPFKGLTYFTEADHEIFFGRNAERLLLATTLLASRFTVVYGESGVGKSSLLRAGVVHDLRERALRERAERSTDATGRRAARFVPVVCSNWLDDPIPACAEAVRAAAEGLVDGPLPDATEGMEFDELLEAWCSSTPATLLIVLDQFEEYLLYHQPDDDRLGAGLALAVGRRDLSLRFIVSIREDSLAKLDRYEEQIPNLLENLIRVEHLDKQAGEAAIRGPVDRYNDALEAGEQRIEVEDELVASVLEQVEREEPGAGGNGSAPAAGGARIETAFLQLVMERLWNEEQKAGSSVIRRATFDRLGGAKQIVFAHLQDAMDDLGEQEQKIAAKAFGRLVTPSRQKYAQSPSDLAKLEEVEPERMTKVLERLSELRILRPVAPPPGSTELRYEIFHDKLADPVLHWRAKFVEEERYEAARARALDQLRLEAQKRRRRAIVTALATLIALAAAGLVGTTLFAARANDISKSRDLAARAVGLIPVEPDRSVQTAARAVRTRATAEAVDALRQALTASRVHQVFDAGRPLSRIAFSPDGSRVAATSPNGDVRIWDVGSDAPPFVIHGDRGWTPVFSPDGKLVVVERYGDHQIWNIATRKEVTHFRAVTGLGITPVFSPNGRLLATTDDNRVTVWNMSTRKAMAADSAGSGTVESVAFSPGGEYLAAVTRKGEATLWQLLRGKTLHLAGHGGTIAKVAFNAKGRLLATAGEDDQTARIWDAATGRQVAVLRTPGEAVESATFSLDGRFVLTLGQSTARVWDTGTWSTLSIRHDNGRLYSGAFSDDSRYVVTAGQDGTAWMWGATNGQTLLVLRGHTNAINDVAFSPDGRFVATASSDGTARLWDVATGDRLPGTQQIATASFSPNGRVIATVGEDRFALLWNRRDLTVTHVLRGHTNVISGVWFSPDGRRVVTSSLDRTARVWNVRTGRQVGPARASKDAVINARFSPDSSRIVTAGLDKLVRIWSVGSDPAPLVLRGHTNYVGDAAFSPDGRYVASASWDGTVRIWNADTGQAVRVLRGHRGGVNTVSFGADDHRLVSSSLDKTAIVWDPTSGTKLFTLIGHTGPVWDAEFDRTGTRIVTASGDGTVRVWDASNGRILGILHAAASEVRTAVFDPTSAARILIASDDGAQIATCATCTSVKQLLHEADRQVARARLTR
jgi:WD40 repeat protein